MFTTTLKKVESPELTSVSARGAGHTCVTCRVVFADATLQREHYKSDWHRYNLKRRVAELPPLPADVFSSKVSARQDQGGEAERVAEKSQRCDVCNKTFRSAKTLVDHCKSKKHLELTHKHGQPDVTALNGPTALAVVGDDSVAAEDGCSSDSGSSWEDIGDEEEEVGETGLKVDECLFCSQSNGTVERALAHMSLKHGFFVPDLDYCTSLDGLMRYLGEKVSLGFVCLWCNERGKSFGSLDAVQKHMRDKGHCKLLHTPQAMLEYADYFDYTASYPDDAGREDVDSEVFAPVLEERDWQLVLPSGCTVGHRTLRRYFKQRLRPETVSSRKQNAKAIQNIVSQYKALGWTGLTGENAIRRAKDVNFMHRLKSKYAMKLGVKANKLQPHFRAAV